MSASDKVPGCYSVRHTAVILTKFFNQTDFSDSTMEKGSSDELALTGA